MQRLRENVGCGATLTIGWLNLDSSSTIRGVRNPISRPILAAAGLLRGKDQYAAAVREHDIRWADAGPTLPLASATAAVIYTSHMLEHMTRDETRQFNAEVLKVLVPDGILRVAVPDFDYHVGECAKLGEPDAFIGRLYMATDRPRGLAAKLRYAIVIERHRLWMYNGQSMADALLKARFAKVLPAGETTIKDSGAIDLAERAPESVFVEATKV